MLQLRLSSRHKRLLRHDFRARMRFYYIDMRATTRRHMPFAFLFQPFLTNTAAGASLMDVKIRSRQRTATRASHGDFDDFSHVEYKARRHSSPHQPDNSRRHYFRRRSGRLLLAILRREYRARFPRARRTLMRFDATR